MTAARPVRARRGEGGGFAAAYSWCAARRRPGDAPREGYGAAPPASRLLRTALRAAALRAGPDPGDLRGPARRKDRPAPACPSGSAARPCPGDGHALLLLTADGNRCSISQQTAKITRNRFEEVSTISGEPHRPPHSRAAGPAAARRPPADRRYAAHSRRRCP